MPDQIQKQITLRAPIERVWRAISNPKEFGTWFGISLSDSSFTVGRRTHGNITNEGYEHLVVEMSVAFSVLVAFIVIGIFLFRIRERFDTVDIIALDQFRGERQ